MTKIQLIKETALMLGLTTREVTPIVNQFISQQAKALKSGKSITIRGLGSLNIVVRKEKKGRLIKEGKGLLIPAHKVVKFKPAPDVKNAVKKLGV